MMPPFLIKARSSRSQAGAWTSGPFGFLKPECANQNIALQPAPSQRAAIIAEWVHTPGARSEPLVDMWSVDMAVDPVPGSTEPVFSAIARQTAVLLVVISKHKARI